MLYAEVILPIAGGVYTFSVEGELVGRVTRGCAVAVQFGARKIVGGIVRRVHDRRPPLARIKPVMSLLFPEAIVSAGQMELWEWMAQYYMCWPGEVMRAALPAMLKPSGFTADEFAADEFRPRRVRVVELAPEMKDMEALNEACEKLRRRAPRQYEALVEIAGRGGLAVPRTGLQTDGAALAALEKKGLIVFSNREQLPEVNTQPFNFQLPELSPTQQRALEELRQELKAHTTALLFGVPASGKSEVCFHAIAGTLARGRDVLMLLPEIALTTQFTGRVRRVFGDRVVIYHSALSDRRRAEAYVRLARRGESSEGGEGNTGSLIIGARSAVFLPMSRLGLVVVDEEQDAGYKQQDPAPRYNARDAAIVLARLHDARVILASATPSLETWANCESGRYGRVELTERWGGTLPPRVVVSDTLRAAKRGERRSHFNKELLDGIGETLARGEQVILFQNRRGMAPFVECTECGHVPRCAHCAIPMTAHRGALRCHYCGASMPIPEVCPACGASGTMATRGFGTEKIEQELARLFPAARIDRLDRDSAGSEQAFRKIINRLEAAQTDILVGTQMVTKGLDFEGVSLVGVLNADNLVNHPDFRASERAYSLMAQVAGRAGRHGGEGARGRVVIQTSSPGSPLIAWAAAGDYRAMAAAMLAERAACGYPPYSRLVRVMLRHADRGVLDVAARRFGELLLAAMSDAGLAGIEVLGPHPPVVEKIKGEFALVFLVKIPRGESMSLFRRTLGDAIATLTAPGAPTAAPALAALRKTSVTVDVDPQ